MIALAYLAAGAIYFSIMFYAVAIAWRWGRRNARTSTRAFICAALAFLAVYLPVFWDHIPTLVAHRYYCGKDGGVVIYKDPEQWVTEHLSERDTLRVRDGGEPVGSVLGDGWERLYLVNRIVAYERRVEKQSVLPGIVLTRLGDRLTDVRSNEVLASYTGYSSGTSFQNGNLRFWVDFSGCPTRPTDGPEWSRVRRALSLGRN